MGLFQDRVEHRGEITGRAIDYPKHFGSGSLLFERLARLGDEARVFNRDNRLRCEALQKRDLLVRERPQLATPGNNHPKQRIVLAQWDGQKGTRGTDFDSHPGCGMVNLRHILNVDKAFARN
jgi:hypothetical protein